MRKKLFDAYGNPVSSRKPLWPWLIGLLLIVDIALVTGPSFAADRRAGQSDPKPRAPISRGSTPSEPDRQQIRVTPTPFPDDYYLGVGETSVVNGMTMTFTDARTSSGNEQIQPADGHLFLLMDFSLSNKGIANYYSFHLYVNERYVERKSQHSHTLLDIKALPAGFIYGDEEQSFTVVYEIQEDWDEVTLGFNTGLIVSYNPFRTPHDLDFRLTPADVKPAVDPTETASSGTEQENTLSSEETVIS